MKSFKKKQENLPEIEILEKNESKKILNRLGKFKNKHTL